MARKKARSTGLMPVAFGAGLILLVPVTVGCASQHDAAAAHASGGGPTPDTASLPRIVIQRTGGFAGLKDTVTIDAHGTWTITSRAGTHTAGRLTADQIAAIRPLATDPRLAAEADRVPPATKCRDAFHYVLTVDTAQIGYAGCPADPGQPEARRAMVKQVLRLTMPGRS